MIHLTRDIAMHHTGTFYHAWLKNADGTPLRCHVTGKCKTWKTRPDEYRLPVKHGLRDTFYLTPDLESEWQITEEDYHYVLRRMMCVRLGVSTLTPAYVLRDMALNAGVDEVEVDVMVGTVEEVTR